MTRNERRADSNNPDNTNKNICALEVAKYLCVHNTVHYLHTINDLVRAARNKYIVRSRKSLLAKGTIGKTRKAIEAKGDALFYIAHVKGHVLLLNREGRTIVDTAPRKKDKRKVYNLYGVYSKPF